MWGLRALHDRLDALEQFLPRGQPAGGHALHVETLRHVQRLWRVQIESQFVELFGHVRQLFIHAGDLLLKHDSVVDLGIFRVGLILVRGFHVRPLRQGLVQ